MMNGADVRVDVRLTLHRDERFFGPGICELLEKIDDTGSIQAAAGLMEMSYTKAWKILNRAEKKMNRRLIIRVNGGKSGGSSTLTPYGKAAVTAFREMEQRLRAESEKVFAEYEDIFLPYPGVKNISYYICM